MNNSEKIKVLNIMLWEAEQENRKLKREIEVKDKIIRDLNTDIYFSDLELEDIRHLMEISRDVNHLSRLEDEVRDLKKSVDVLSDIVSYDICF